MSYQRIASYLLIYNLIILPRHLFDGLDALVADQVHFAAQDPLAECAVGERGQGPLVADLPEVL